MSLDLRLPVPEVSLVTGASSGIGRATALRLAALGSTVVVGYNTRREAAETVVAELDGKDLSRCASRSTTPKASAPRPARSATASAGSTHWSTMPAAPSRCRSPTSTP